jgi:GntR family transcriptional regulator of arabinose operon
MNSGKTKYYVIMEQLKEDILSGKIKPRDKIQSENELAMKYNVSRQTVRKALAILINDGYIKSEHGRGTYCVDRRAYSKKSRNIAVITTYISDYIFPRLIQGIDNVLTENDYSIILKNTANSRKREILCLEDILTKDIDGLIIEPSKSEILYKDIGIYDTLDKMGIPYVFIQGIYKQMKNKPYVIMDDVKGTYLLTKYLIELGHKDIIGIFKADDTQGTFRHKGYVKALQEAGMKYEPDNVIWFHTEDRSIKPAEAISLFIDEKKKMDAIVCYNDMIAYEVIDILNKCGINIPEEISVTGYDNLIIGNGNTIKLTTISHPKEKLGEIAAKLLLELIRDTNSGNLSYVLEPELVTGNSCCKR